MTYGISIMQLASSCVAYLHVPRLRRLVRFLVAETLGCTHVLRKYRMQCTRECTHFMYTATGYMYLYIGSAVLIFFFSCYVLVMLGDYYLNAITTCSCCECVLGDT